MSKFQFIGVIFTNVVIETNGDVQRARRRGPDGHLYVMETTKVIGMCARCSTKTEIREIEGKLICLQCMIADPALCDFADIAVKQALNIPIG